MFPDDLIVSAQHLLGAMRQRRLLLATAESCTGGLISALLTEIAGSSDVVERGLVTYSNAAKIELLGVPQATLETYGAVSRETALAMVAGALRASHANLAVAVTGVAGPGGGTVQKPVGLVHLAVQMRGSDPVHQQARYGDIGRQQVRLETVRTAMAMLSSL